MRCFNKQPSNNAQNNVISITDRTDQPIPSNKRAEALLALAKLVEYRDHFNKLDGFKVDWNNPKVTKWCITIDGRKVNTFLPTNRYFLYFGNKITRDQFYDTFHELISQVQILY
ncbi:hypothetical protein [Olivibacter sitiensis]|uniref:hypothetical protein n=1 Tax=Olivibacter sitiensis TaxID=376470 RepID=UPI0012F8E1CE|nr:hypothetical protein [Olivibacter sitiensis]